MKVRRNMDWYAMRLIDQAAANFDKNTRFRHKIDCGRNNL